MKFKIDKKILKQSFIDLVFPVLFAAPFCIALVLLAMYVAHIHVVLGFIASIPALIVGVILVMYTMMVAINSIEFKNDK